VRLALRAPDNPANIMGTEPMDQANMLSLSPTEVEIVSPSQVWGLLIRTNDLLPVIPYTVHLKKAGMAGDGILVGREPRELNQFYNYQQVRYRGGILPFRITDTPIDLEIGSAYRLTVSLTHPETNQVETVVYRLQAS